MLETKQLSFSYDGECLILNELNMRFEEGQIYGLLGANGSGKSTLFLALMGLIKPQQGAIQFNQEPLDYHKKALHVYRQAVALVFQNPEQQIFYSIVKDDVAFSLRNLGFSEEIVTQRVAEALQQLGISHLEDSPIQYLSYGQKKRVAIAGALVLNTQWLLLDEPTAGLDPDGRRRMIEIIKELSKQGKHIIISSHDMELVYEIGTYFYILKKGLVLKEGTKHEIFEDEALLLEAKLEQPWLVKVRQQFNLLFFDNEQAFFDNYKNSWNEGSK